MVPFLIALLFIYIIVGFYKMYWSYKRVKYRKVFCENCKFHDINWWGYLECWKLNQEPDGFVTTHTADREITVKHLNEKSNCLFYYPENKLDAFMYDFLYGKFSYYFFSEKKNVISLIQSNKDSLSKEEIIRQIKELGYVSDDWKITRAYRNKEYFKELIIPIHSVGN